MILISFADIKVRALYPTNVPPTVPIELPMVDGYIDPNYVSTTEYDQWEVGYKFYRLTKMEVWYGEGKGGGNDGITGIKVTFSPPDEFIGYSDIERMFGYTNNKEDEEPINFEITSIAVGVDQPENLW